MNFHTGLNKVAHITAAKRHALPKKDFALPGEHYPIDTEARGRAALSYGARFASPEQLATIKKKVHARYPSIGKDKE